MESGSRPASDEGSMRLSMVRSYGTSAARIEGGMVLFMHILVLMIALMTAPAAVAQASALQATRSVKMVVLGDSLSAGLGLPASDAFPQRLQKVLQNKGIEADVTNAGVSGDTSSGGRDRLDWSVPDGTDAVILELGANDALRGLDPKVTRAALDAILRKLADRRIVVLLAGMQAPRNLGPEYARDFDSIYPALASTHPVVFYPFFLEGVAADSKLNQADGLHPNAAGVDTIVARILPRVEELIVRARAARAS